MNLPEHMPALRIAWRRVIYPRLVPSCSGCMEWPSARTQKGYGLVLVAGRMMRAHRVALAVKIGRPLGELLACHSCDNPPCCNPAHLFAGKPLDNHGDAVAKKRKTLGVSRVQKWRGVEHGRARLSEATVKRVRRLARTMPQTAVADLIGISRSHVAKIVLRTRWAHLK